MGCELEDRVFYGSNIIVSKRNDGCTEYKMRDASGAGTMTCYKVFPGVDIIYNDFHMKSCFSEFRPKVEMIGIDHCRDGQIEWEIPGGAYRYLQKGDLQINAKDRHAGGFRFPSGHYRGITLAIYIEEASKTLSTIFDGFSIDLHALRANCSGERLFIMRMDDSIQHIFSELYKVPEKIRKSYFKIKVLEILLFLSAVDVPISGQERPYLPPKQVEKVKAIKQYITDNIDKHFTLEELSRQFGIPLTSMKASFKGIYGTSIYAYIRSHRMQIAASMLRQTRENVTTVAGRVGYNNPSKFAAAFKKVIGVSPAQYQKDLA